MKKGPFEEIAREKKYENKWLRVEEATLLRPGGFKSTFGLIYMSPGVTVVALDEAQNILLVREYKYAVERETIELVSGAIEEGESVNQAGARELREETGWSASKIISLGAIDPFTTIISSRNYIVLAEQLVQDEMDVSQEDIVTPLRVPFQQAVEMVETGEITHGASCIGILRVARLLANRDHRT